MAYSPTHSVLQFYSSNKCTFTHTFTNSFSVTVHQTSARSLTHSPTPCYNFIHQTSARSLIHSPAHCYNCIHQTSARSLTHSPTHTVLQLYSQNKCTFTHTILFMKQVHVHSYIHQLDSVLQFYSTQCYNFIHQTVHVHSHIHQLDSVLQFDSPNKCTFTHTFTRSLSHTQSLAHSLTHLLAHSHSIHSLAPSWPSAQCPCSNNFLFSRVNL